MAECQVLLRSVVDQVSAHVLLSINEPLQIVDVAHQLSPSESRNEAAISCRASSARVSNPNRRAKPWIIPS
jgi:hypothetical protein